MFSWKNKFYYQIKPKQISSCYCWQHLLKFVCIGSWVIVSSSFLINMEENTSPDYRGKTKQNKKNAHSECSYPVWEDVFRATFSKKPVGTSLHRQPLSVPRCGLLWVHGLHEASCHFYLLPTFSIWHLQNFLGDNASLLFFLLSSPIFHEDMPIYLYPVSLETKTNNKQKNKTKLFRVLDRPVWRADLTFFLEKFPWFPT